jgi:hypothetical protein
MIITITEKPTTGRMDRVCHKCGDTYNGWNFAVCKSCERAGGYTVELAY